MMTPSLKNLCTVPGLLEILNYPQIKKEIFSLAINEYNYKGRDDTLQKVVSEYLKDSNRVIKENIPRHFITLIGFEMTKWAESLKECFDLSFNFSEHFIKSSFFTSEGLLDEEKAARELLKEQSFSNFLKYKIACHYFFEDIIPGLWKHLRNNEPNFEEWLKENNHPECPMVMWSEYLEKINKSSSELNLDDDNLTLTLRLIDFKESVFSYGLRNNNLAAVKFSCDPKGRSRKVNEEVKIVRKLVDTCYHNFIRDALKHIEFYEISTQSLFCRKFLADRNIIIYLLSLMNKEELKDFFLKFDSPFCVARFFLLWPYHYQFMNFMHIIFENSAVLECVKLMLNIISLISEKYMCQIYNYRMLLRNVLNKCPAHLKEHIVVYTAFNENDVPCKLITTLFSLPNFSPYDLEIVNLILKYATISSRMRILTYHGIRICDHLIVSHGNFKLANLFLKTLDLDENILQQFKKQFVHKNFLNIMKKQSISLFEDIFKWAFGSDDIDDFKDKIFRTLTIGCETEYFFIEYDEEVPFCFLKKIAKWFLKTDENVKEWVNNIEYSPTIAYKYPKWFDRLLKYRGYTDEESSVIKRDVIFGKLPEIAREFFLSSNGIKNSFLKKILVLSLLKKEEILEFNGNLRSFYELCIKQKMCLMCLNTNKVYGNGEGDLCCELHGTMGFISFTKITSISGHVNQIDFLLERYERRLKREHS